MSIAEIDNVDFGMTHKANPENPENPENPASPCEQQKFVEIYFTI